MLLWKHVYDFLSCFAVLGWQNTCESVDAIKATLAALATEIDISVLYRGLDPKNVHRLVSVVCIFVIMTNLQQQICYSLYVVIMGKLKNVITRKLNNNEMLCC